MSSDSLAARLVRGRGDLLSRILLAAVELAAIAWFSPGPGLPLDDAWIHQVVGRTLAETGTLGYAPGQHGAAATSYLWAALLGLNFKLLHIEPSRWALLLNIASALASGQLMLSLLRDARPREDARWPAIALAVTAFAFVSPNVLWFVCSGMEAMPFVALSLAAMRYATDRADDGRIRRPLVAGLCAGALALLRPEAVPLGGLLATYALVRTKSVRASAAIAGPWLAGFAIYVGSNLAKTGQALPSTLAGRRWLWFEMSSGLGRSDMVFDFLDAWATRLGSYTLDTSLAVVWILVAIAAYGAIVLVRARNADGMRAVVGWALAHAGLYALMLPTPGHGGRYQPFTPLSFALLVPLGTAFILEALVRTVASPRGFAWFAAAGTVPWIALAVPVATDLRHANALAVAHIQATELDAGAYVAELPEGAVASFDIGGIGFATTRRVLDLGGLSDAKTALLLREGRVSTWLAENRVRWIVLPQSSETVLPVFDDFTTRLHLRDNASLRLVPIRVFETPLDKWAPAIKATWNAAPKQVVYEVTYTDASGPRAVPIVAPETRRAIADPGSLASRSDRTVAEHMLAVLDAWGVQADIQLTAPPEHEEVSTAAAGCTLRIGWWGFGVDGCSMLDAAVVRSLAYEQAGRYLDAGDLGGALRALPHVLAQAKRRSDATFHPPLAPLAPPMPGGGALGSARAGGFGLLLLFGVLVFVMGIEALARTGRVSNLVERARAHIGRKSAAPVVTVMLLVGCGRANVCAAIGEGRGAVEIALANGGTAGPDPGSHRIPLLEAAARGDADIVALLLAHGAAPDARGGDGTTALHAAARTGHASATIVLASASTPDVIEATAGPRRRTALHDAVASGSVETVSALLDAGARPNVKDTFGQTPLHLVALVDPVRSGPIAARLLAAGADAKSPDARGFTALHAAAVTDNVAVLRELSQVDDLRRGRTPSGETAIAIARRYGRDRATEVLRRAPDGDVEENDSWPPLHDAARTDSVERASALLASGLGNRTEAFHGKTPLDVAREHGSRRVEAILRGP